MIRFLAPYVLVPLVLALLWFFFQAQSLREDVTELEAKLSLATLQQSACVAANINIKEDEDSDATIENMPDSSLRDVPGRWIMPETGTGSSGIP